MEYRSADSTREPMTLAFQKLTRYACMAAFAVMPMWAVDNVLHPGTPTFDRPTLMAIGVRVPVSGDDNYNARIDVRYKPAGTSTWYPSMSLHRVRPETVATWVVPASPEFAG